MLTITTSNQRIKIYNKIYEVPVLSDSSFVSFQEQLNTRQALISTGKRSTKLLGFISKHSEISVESRFEELERLIEDYNELITFLNDHKEAYQQFFLDLTTELKAIVGQKCKELAQTELERLQLEKEVGDDELLLSTLKNQQQQIFKSAFLLHQATQLMLKKVELINKSIQKLATDQEQQKELLEGMIGRLDKYRKTYALQQKINKIEKDIAAMADAAINFEQYLSDFLSPFQGLIDQVVKVDGELTRTVEEIKLLAGDIVNPNIAVLDTGSDFSNNIVEFMVASTNKQDHIEQTLQEIRFSNATSIDELLVSSEVLEVTSLSKAISSIQNTVGEQLTQFHKSVHSSSHKVTSSVKKLQEYLEQQEWLKADQTTKDILLTVANRNNRPKVSDIKFESMRDINKLWSDAQTLSNWLRVEDIKNLPFELLQEIDQLWLDSSNGRFGFSIQANIYQELGGSDNFNWNTWLNFCDRVGWRVNDDWPDYDEFNYSSLQEGQLPLLAIAGNTPRFTVFFWSRLVTFAQQLSEK
ncbi:GUN4 domain protein (plasmid) [Gloeothece citriformis PCC 7424]|uniref:GUN4 domain protein n=1 Tax=Gloeothece citriformis (strain PCC 7424) TaxID=65393 RepID=B7KMJ5_GLOC7|nr:GUN4 domain-containing protein [Gloeothece citriformis]ACK74017.1 GUN4 domain protein [Gloeothece citriformis PCC 7424]